MTGTYAQTWDLDTLAPSPDSEAFRVSIDSYRQELDELADSADSLPALDPDDPVALFGWEEFLKRLEAVVIAGTELDAFVGCHAAADANNTKLQQLEAELSSMGPSRARVSMAVQMGLQSTSPEDLAVCLQRSEHLRTISYWLTDQRELAALRLPPEQELLAAELDVDGLHAWGRLYDRVSGSLRITLMEDGELVEKSPGQVQFDASDRSIRRNNYLASLRAWRTVGETCADALNHISGTRLTKYGRLGLTDHLDAPLRFNRMRRETLETMWATIDERKESLLGFLNTKAHLLGLSHLEWCDLQAPLPGASESSRVDYDTGCDLIISAFDQFSSDFGDFARKTIEERWIEAEDRDGKRQGGFCTGFPGKKQSRIFMTYVGTLDSMSTLAHEIGHAYHSHVLKTQPLFLQDYPMNLAETASTFAEAVLGESRLADSRDESEQLAILDTMLNDSVAFLMNIHARFLFEDRFHIERASGELAAGRFSDLMVEAQQEAYLGALGENGWNDTFWISKLHFYISSLPFYNFPYTFGYLLSLGLYAIARDSGAGAFPTQYCDFLKATGDRCTEDAVRDSFGHDLAQPDFWHRSLDVVSERVSRFERLAG